MEIITKREAEREMYEGLKVYGENDKRIEFLTLGKSDTNIKDIYKEFTNNFCQKIDLVSGLMGNVLTSLDSVTIVSLPSGYQFTMLDIPLAYMVYDSLVEFISEV